VGDKVIVSPPVCVSLVETPNVEPFDTLNIAATLVGVAKLELPAW
jgi:hypothetical protein